MLNNLFEVRWLCFVYSLGKTKCITFLNSGNFRIPKTYIAPVTELFPSANYRPGVILTWFKVIAPYFKHDLGERSEQRTNFQSYNYNIIDRY